MVNAAYIDMVLATLKDHPDAWRKVRYTSYGDSYEIAWSIANKLYGDIVQSGIWKNMLNAAWHARINTSALCGTILALIAYEDSAHLLDSTPEEIRLLVALGHPYAILMLPAAAAFENIPEMPSI